MEEGVERGFVHAQDSFLHKLSWQQLQQMRRVVRRVHRRHATSDISDRECDRIIEALGPKAVEESLKKLVDGKLHTMITP